MHALAFTGAPKAAKLLKSSGSQHVGQHWQARCVTVVHSEANENMDVENDDEETQILTQLEKLNSPVRRQRNPASGAMATISAPHTSCLTPDDSDENREAEAEFHDVCVQTQRVLFADDNHVSPALAPFISGDVLVNETQAAESELPLSRLPMPDALRAVVPNSLPLVFDLISPPSNASLNPSADVAYNQIAGDGITPLSQCIKDHSFVNLMGLLVQVEQAREVFVKRGLQTGKQISVGTWILADPSRENFRVSLWNDAAKWEAEIGTVVHLDHVKITKYNNDFVGSTWFGSTTYIEKEQPAQAQRRLHLWRWGRVKHNHLYKAGFALQHKAQDTTLSSLIPSTRVNVIVKLASVQQQPAGAPTYKFGKQRLMKIVVKVQDPEMSSVIVPLLLWGRQAEWKQRIELEIMSKKAYSTLWRFRELMVRGDSHFGGESVSLHTTIASIMEPASARNGLTKETTPSPTIIPSFAAKSVAALLAADLNGNAHVTASIGEWTFLSEDGELISMESDKSIVFIGCSKCARPLVKTAENAFGPCTYCIHQLYVTDLDHSIFFYPASMVIHDVENKRSALRATVTSLSLARLLPKTLPTAYDVWTIPGQLQLFKDKFYEWQRQPHDFELLCRTLFDSCGYVSGQSFECLNCDA